MRAALVFLALLVGQAASAQPVPPVSTVGINLGATVLGNTTTYSPTVIDAGNVGKFGYSVSTAGDVFPETYTYHVPPGQQGSFKVNAKGTVNRAAVGAALGRFARKALPVLSTGFALYDLANELEFALNNSGGELEVQRTLKGEAWCNWLSGGYCNSGYETGAPGESLDAYVARVMSPSLGPVLNSSANSRQFNAGWYHFNKVPVAPVVVPSSIEEFEEAIADKPTWPADSSLARALRDAIKAGEKVEIVPQITGPASRPGPTSTKTDSATGNTTTSNTVHNYTYNNNTVTNNTTTTTTVTNAAGDVVNQTTETTEPENTEAPSDTPLPDVPTLYTQKYPGGMAGVWVARKAQVMATPLLSMLGNLFPTVAGSNACPQFSIAMNLGRWDFGTYDLGPPCFVWDFIRVCMVVLALFMARRLIFGG